MNVWPPEASSCSEHPSQPNGDTALKISFWWNLSRTMDGVAEIALI